MFDLNHLLAYELCTPGGLLGETELACPHCGELLSVPVNDPDGEEAYQCCECDGPFEVDWAEGVVSTLLESRQKECGEAEPGGLDS